MYFRKLFFSYLDLSKVRILLLHNIDLNRPISQFFSRNIFLVKTIFQKDAVLILELIIVQKNINFQNAY